MAESDPGRDASLLLDIPLVYTVATEHISAR